MEIKRALNALAKRMTPTIEIMNVATEMKRMCERFDELLDYAEEKEERSAERKETIGARVQTQKDALQAKINAQQKAESDENLADQKESFDERNKKLMKSQPQEDPTKPALAEPDDEKSPAKAAAAKGLKKKKPTLKLKK